MLSSFTHSEPLYQRYSIPQQYFNYCYILGYHGDDSDCNIADYPFLF